MADWSNPTILSNYVTFVDEVKNRDIDAITLTAIAITNPPVNSIKLLRSPVKFQQWSGSAYTDLVLSVAGGGTGATSLSGMGSAMGLGTMAYQNANNVSISGGYAGPITILANSVIQAPLTCNGPGTFSFNGTPNLDSVYIGGGVGAFGLRVAGHGPDGSGGGGILISAGTTGPDYALLVHSQDFSLVPLLVKRGHTQCREGFVIPVGVDRWVP